jgi:hypothetical protein
MGEWLAKRILAGALTYTDVIARYPQFKTEIDAYLTEKKRPDLIVG